MITRMITIVAMAALLLSACDESASKTSKDVTQARVEASQDSSEARQEASQVESKSVDKVVDAQQAYAKTDAKARQKLTQVESEAMIAGAKADFDVAKTKAEGSLNIAMEKCGALKGVDKTACLSTADANFTAEVAAATADRDTVIAQLTEK